MELDALQPQDIAEMTTQHWSDNHSRIDDQDVVESFLLEDDQHLELQHVN